MTANAGFGPWLCSVHEYVGGTRGSGIVSCAADVLGMSVMRGVGGVCEICMCLAQGRRVSG